MTSTTASGITGFAFLGMAKSQETAAAPTSAPLFVGASHGPLAGLRACALPSSCEFFQQRLGFLEVSRVKPLGEPAIDRRQELAGSVALALLLP